MSIGAWGIIFGKPPMFYTSDQVLPIPKGDICFKCEHGVFSGDCIEYSCFKRKDIDPADDACEDFLEKK